MAADEAGAAGGEDQGLVVGAHWNDTKSRKQKAQMGLTDELTKAATVCTETRRHTAY